MAAPSFLPSLLPHSRATLDGSLVSTPEPLHWRHRESNITIPPSHHLAAAAASAAAALLLLLLRAAGAAAEPVRSQCPRLFNHILPIFCSNGLHRPNTLPVAQVVYILWSPCTPAKLATGAPPEQPVWTPTHRTAPTPDRMQGLLDRSSFLISLFSAARSHKDRMQQRNPPLYFTCCGAVGRRLPDFLVRTVGSLHNLTAGASPFMQSPFWNENHASAEACLSLLAVKAVNFSLGQRRDVFRALVSVGLQNLNTAPTSKLDTPAESKHGFRV
ncbi:hypothetical protein CC78DRAFT_584604 [Lojkania enalia]|uniref:Uncharacterized protein n=1 Tax=Lojkania enalia TaxID=147567 RepID=A0A9P4K0G5_9PLEO|nr:hypothetical protein CC78DRAFT_584604 [Didymosphaeria enalia]